MTVAPVRLAGEVRDLPRLGIAERLEHRRQSRVECLNRFGLQLLEEVTRATLPEVAANILFPRSEPSVRVTERHDGARGQSSTDRHREARVNHVSKSLVMSS